MDLHALAWRRLAALSHSADVRRQTFSASLFSLAATPASVFGLTPARIRSSSHDSNFMPISRGLRQITRQRRRVAPFSASSNTKLSGRASEIGDADMRTAVRDIGNHALTALTRVEHDPRIAAQAMSSRLSFVPRISPRGRHNFQRLALGHSVSVDCRRPLP